MPLTAATAAGSQVTSWCLRPAAPRWCPSPRRPWLVATGRDGGASPPRPAPSAHSASDCAPNFYHPSFLHSAALGGALAVGEAWPMLLSLPLVAPVVLSLEPDVDGAVDGLALGADEPEVVLPGLDTPGLDDAPGL